MGDKGWWPAHVVRRIEQVCIDPGYGTVTITIHDHRVKDVATAIRERESDVEEKPILADLPEEGRNDG